MKKDDFDIYIWYEIDLLLKRFAFLPGFSSRNFSSGNKFESLATRIMDERYSAIQEGAGAKNRGPEINHPSYFRIESSINHFPLFSPHCASSHQRSGTGAERSPRGSRNNPERNSTLDFHGIRPRDGSFQLFYAYIRLESLGYQANS